MVQRASREWLIAYDIADKRRLSRLQRFIRKHAVPLQYSLYWYRGSSVEVDRLLRDIETRIDRAYDDVRAYPVPQQTSIDCLGHASLPSDLVVLGTDVLRAPIDRIGVSL